MENAGKESLTIRARNVTLEIVEASGGKIKIKSNCAGQVIGLGSPNSFIPNGSTIIRRYVQY
ncbi:MAG TPA: hypothetical protein VE573_11715 [Nitrososphaeraceae archaeon]|jgi:hypothetical protein|nr:hypothetical protein [Nitrososphaeraceae archaeon]